MDAPSGLLSHPGSTFQGEWPPLIPSGPNPTPPPRGNGPQLLSNDCAGLACKAGANPRGLTCLRGAQSAPRKALRPTCDTGCKRGAQGPLRIRGDPARGAGGGGGRAEISLGTLWFRVPTRDRHMENITNRNKKGGKAQACLISFAPTWLDFWKTQTPRFSDPADSTGSWILALAPPLLPCIALAGLLPSLSLSFSICRMGAVWRIGDRCWLHTAQRANQTVASSSRQSPPPRQLHAPLLSSALLSPRNSQNWWV